MAAVAARSRNTRQTPPWHGRRRRRKVRNGALTLRHAQPQKDVQVLAVHVRFRGAKKATLPASTRKHPKPHTDVCSGGPPRDGMLPRNMTHKGQPRLCRNHAAQCEAERHSSSSRPNSPHPSITPKQTRGHVPPRARPDNARYASPYSGATYASRGKSRLCPF